ncbi:sigma 54-interacting transcriptional regulator [Anaerosalibacter massiliensis]|uniref:Sigma 54-interacting transcriptional regulator n=1 Tax=Anaerosalibacter massiliensis TaxID=1347392 RepID=A0A9X2S609_9FIRM|nr:sigma 54-interacting transcriptional regulator [Anaerosalibacter massiliensis]MCR2045135.1 sigma 54-interacting transcriptional regulator [Anaerosalibacter massiliensis]
MRDTYLKNINMKYVDAIMIVDNKGRIVYSVRFNPRFDKDGCEDELESIINRKFLEVYPTIKPEESSVITCLKYGLPIYREHQKFYDEKGRVYNTQNLTLPIIRSGKILGTIELSKDITRIKEDTPLIEKESVSVINTPFRSDEFSVKYEFKDIITRNEEMKENIEKAKLIADSSSSILVYGETGTGKELYVQSIHNYSSRYNRPFIAQNCAALPESLFESILFGSVKGAFTGSTDKPGLFEQAHGGTLFLDEINSMPISLQAKLLRVLQDGVIRRIGDSKDRKVDVRIIVAMNVEPLKAIEIGQLREDLFYRLNVVNIRLVPLRDRKEDILLYVEHFINKYNKELNKNVKGISKEVEELFMLYNWPGNVRELQHIIEASVNIINEGNIKLENLPIYLSEKIKTEDDESPKEHFYFSLLEGCESLDNVVNSIEKKMIIDALEKSKGNISKAAEVLKITRQRLYYKMDKHNIQWG